MTRIISFLAVACFAVAVHGQEIITTSQRGANVTAFTSFERPGFFPPAPDPTALDNPSVVVGVATFGGGGFAGTRNFPPGYLTGDFVWLTPNRSTIAIDGHPNRVSFHAADIDRVLGGAEVGGLLIVTFNSGKTAVYPVPPPISDDVAIGRQWKRYEFANVRSIVVDSTATSAPTNIDDFSVRFKRPPGQDKKRGNRGKRRGR